MHGFDLIATIAGGFTAALILGYITQRIGLSPLVGYLLAGVLVGPHTPGFVADAALAEQLAEIGVILLMFGVGLQFHFDELLAVRGVAVPGAIAQSVAATLLGAAVALAFGWSWPAALVFGIALSVASTVVLVRVLADNRDLHTPTGHIAVGWLVVEDLFTVVVLVLLPALFGARAASGSALALSLGLTALKVAGLVAFTAFVGTRVIPWLLDRVAETRSRELFTLTVLALALGIALGAADRLRRLDGAWRLSGGHGRRTVRVQPACRVRGAADARRVRRPVLRLGRHAARAGYLLEAPLLVGGDAGGGGRGQAAGGDGRRAAAALSGRAWPLPWRSRWRRSESSRSSWPRWGASWACCHPRR